MATQALASFAEQLANWGKQAIALGRSPFRKVETDLPLLTSDGELRAPLVFWINRDSFMAGGLLLFPRQHPDEVLSLGCQLADAIGLQQFVTWSAQESSIWQLTPQGPRHHSSIPLPPAGHDQVEPFRQLLIKVMDELKLLSVMAAPAPAELSPFYLANLCRETLRDSLDELATQARIEQHQASRSALNQSPYTVAFGKACLSLFRLLALICHDRLPPNIRPEGLERALRFALPGLPDELSTPLRFTATDLALPDSVAVRFHHLFRRLLQLDLMGRPERTAACCRMLLQTADERLLGKLGAEPESSATGSALTLELNRATSSTPAESLIEVAPQPLLAGRALLRSLQGASATRSQETDLWRVDASLPIQRVLAWLGPEQRPTREKRLQMETALRSTWPTRRFQFAPETPEWLYQALHLLGLCRPGGELELALPDSWLGGAWGDPLWETLCADFSLLTVIRTEPGWLHLQLRRGLETLPVTICGETQSSLTRNQLTTAPRRHLGYRLQLPEAWCALLDRGLLVAPPAAPTPQERAALQRFFLSSPGRELAKLGGITTVQGTAPELEQLLRQQVPVPNAELLSHLAELVPSGNPALLVVDDEELLDWLGNEFRDLPQVLPAQQTGQPLLTGERQRSSRALPRQLADEVFVDGIPQFPEHYLYDHYRPELVSYRWQGHLQLEASFFGQIRLQDSFGQTLEISGEVLARSLLLIDRSGRQQAELPADTQLAEAILMRYLKDLQGLYDRLNLLACRQGQDPRSVARLVRSVWGSQPLPPWEEVKSVAAFFSLPGHVE